MKVVVTGAAGHLGAAIVEEFSRGHEVVALTRPDLDITSRPSVRSAMDRLQPDAIINCAAYNDVDAAQRGPMPALEINAFGVLALARAAAAFDAPFVHFSTDFVFDGDASRPYVEEDPTSPRSFYGCSKLLGEWLARDAGHAYVFRVESLFGGPTAGTTAREGSLGRIVRGIRNGETIPVFTDRTVSPSYAPDVSKAVRGALERSIAPGLYHCVNEGHATWDTVAREAARLLGMEAKLKPITLDSLDLTAPRPRYCALNAGKLAAEGIVMPPWQDAMRAWLSRG